MEDYIAISTLNDFTFCPYSIYLHNVYIGTDKELYEATPQVRGTLGHKATDEKHSSTRRDVLLALPVYSECYRLMGRIDVYRQRERLLIERKQQLKKVFPGQLYQLWAQYFCLREMGYEVEALAFYEIATNKMLPQPLPTVEDEARFEALLRAFLSYDPGESFVPNPNKCRHCIYCNLCDKTDQDNVYN